MERLFQDLRQAARSLSRQPLVAIGGTVTLGLGIGVTTAFFAIVDAVLLAPMAAHADPVVRIWKHDVERNVSRFPFSYHELELWNERTRIFGSLAAITYADTATAAVVVGNTAVPVTMATVSADFFRTVADGPPRLGRWWTAADEGNAVELPAIVSDRFWRAESNGDPAFVGRRLAWPGGGRSMIVVGIAPPSLDYPLGTDLWLPIDGYYTSDSDPALNLRNRRFAQFHFLGRLAAGVSMERARAELDLLNRGIVAAFPDDYRSMPVVVEPLLDATLGAVRPLVWVLFAGAALAFTAAGGNVAAMLLMRATARERDAALRVALGASRFRLATHTVGEAALLGAGGAVAGVAMAQLSLLAARAIAGHEIARFDRVTIDTSAVAFGAAAALLWIAAASGVSLWRERRHGLRLTPHLAVRASRSTAMLRTIVAVQVTVALVVAVAAGLLVRSLVQLRAVDRGFEQQNVAALEILLPPAQYPSPSSRERLYTRLVSRLGGLPGVEAATAVHLGPGTGETGLSAPMVYEGQQAEEARRNPYASWDPILPSYFETLRIPITRGRAFGDADDERAPPVAIVSESVARQFWPGQDPIGKRVKLGERYAWAVVVGVAADTRYRELTRTWLTVYYPARQSFFFSPGALLVRTASASAPVIEAIRRVVNEEEPMAAVSAVHTIDALASQEIARPTAAVAIATVFALLAIVVTVAGVYSVFSYDVVLGARELAVHSAIGASPRQLLRMILRRALVVAAAGTAVGLLAAVSLARYLRALLYGIEPLDAPTFAAAAATMMAVVTLATLRPAARAAATDPVVLLRAE